VFLGKFLDPAVQPIVIPSEGNEHPLLFVAHDVGS
jgi:hypothetical protein